MRSRIFLFLTILLELTKGKVGLALGLIVALSLMEGISLLMLVPLLQLVGLDVQQGFHRSSCRVCILHLFNYWLRPTLITVLCVYVFIVIIHSLLRRWETSASLTLQYEFVVRLQQRLYRAIANTSWLFFIRNRASDFTHALTIEMERIGAATYYILNLLATGIVAIVYVLFALKLSPMMTGLVFLCGGGLIFFLKKKTKVAHETGEGVIRSDEWSL